MSTVQSTERRACSPVRQRCQEHQPSGAQRCGHQVHGAGGVHENHQEENHGGEPRAVVSGWGAGLRLRRSKRSSGPSDGSGRNRGGTRSEARRRPEAGCRRLWSRSRERPGDERRELRRRRSFESGSAGRFARSATNGRAITASTSRRSRRAVILSTWSVSGTMRCFRRSTTESTTPVKCNRSASRNTVEGGTAASTRPARSIS